jgi:hypothetical protein
MADLYQFHKIVQHLADPPPVPLKKGEARGGYAFNFMRESSVGLEGKSFGFVLPV